MQQEGNMHGMTLFFIITSIPQYLFVIIYIYPSIYTHIWGYVHHKPADSLTRRKRNPTSFRNLVSISSVKILPKVRVLQVLTKAGLLHLELSAA